MSTYHRIRQSASPDWADKRPEVERQARRAAYIATTLLVFLPVLALQRTPAQAQQITVAAVGSVTPIHQDARNVPGRWPETPDSSCSAPRISTAPEQAARYTTPSSGEAAWRRVIPATVRARLNGRTSGTSTQCSPSDDQRRCLARPANQTSTGLTSLHRVGMTTTQSCAHG